MKFQVAFFFFKLDFFPLFENWQKFFHLKVISKKKKKNQRNFSGSKNPRFWHLKSDFFPIEIFFEKFSKIGIFFFTWTLFLKNNKKIQRNFFDHSLTHSLITTRFARGAQEGGVGVREANYVRGSKLRQVYKLRQECKLRRATAVVRGPITPSYGRR